MASNADSFSRRTWAVAIGVSSFVAGGLEQLASPAPDARRFAAALSSEIGCDVPPAQVRCLPAAGAAVTRAEVLAAVREAVSDVPVEGILILYFAGHGLRQEEEYYLCTSDTVLSRLDDTAVSGSNLQGLLSPLKARGLLLIVDCCRSAGLAEAAPAVFRQLDRGDFRILLSASRAGQSSWELGEGKGTLFSNHLIQTVDGSAVVGDKPGQVFFSDLLRHLHDRIREDVESLHPGLEQEPVFTGVFSRDPLLFLHKRLMLAQVEVRTSRYSREYLRRMAARVAAGFLGITLFALGALYTFIEEHQFAQTSGSAIALYTGHPRLALFGFPHRFSVLDWGPGAVAGGSPLEREHGVIVAPLGEAVLPLVVVDLKPEYRSLLYVQQGRQQEARRELRRLVRRNLRGTGDTAAAAVELFGHIAEPADLPLLKSLLGSGRSDVAGAALLGVLRLDRGAGLQVAPGIIGADVAVSTRVLRALGGRCDATANGFLLSTLNNRHGFSEVPDVLDAALRLGCPLGVRELLQRLMADADIENREDLMEFGILTYGEFFRRVLLGLVAAEARAKLPAEELNATSHLASALGFGLAPDHGCPADLPSLLRAAAPELEEQVAISLLRLCGAAAWPQIAGEITNPAVQRRIGLQTELIRQGALDPRAALAGAARGGYGPALLDALGARDLAGLEPLLFDLTREDGAVRQRAIRLLRQACVPSFKATGFLSDTTDGVREEAFLWLFQDRPQRALAELLGRMGDQSAAFIPEVLVQAQLPAIALPKVREYLGGSPIERDHAAAALAVLGTGTEAAALLESDDTWVRRGASEMVSAREDLPAVVQRLEARAQANPEQPHFLYSPVEQLAQRQSFASELSKVPAWARSWRSGLLQRSQAPLRGLELWLERQVSAAPGARPCGPSVGPGG